jgi:hypothetical protein
VDRVLISGQKLALKHNTNGEMMDIKDLVHEKMLAEMLVERDAIIFNQEMVIQELRKEIEELKQKEKK